MNLQKLILTENECYIVGAPLNVKGIMVHSTGANNPNLRRYVGPNDGLLGDNRNGNHWNKFRPDGRQVCTHGFIGLLADGSVASYQTLPWDMRGWHGGKGLKGSANDTHIGFEICEDGLEDGDYFAKVYQEAVELCAYLCKMFSLDPNADGVLICHCEGYQRGIASNHSDVMHWFPKHGKSMDTLRSDVAALLNAAAPQAFSSYIVKVSIPDLNIRTGPGTNNPAVGVTGIGSYTIVDEAQGPGATKWGKLKSGAGWISLDYVDGGCEAAPAVAPREIAVGDIVNFTGEVHYPAADGDNNYKARKGLARVTSIHKGAKHPYHIIHVDGTSNVYGWVDAGTVSL